MPCYNFIILLTRERHVREREREREINNFFFVREQNVREQERVIKLAKNILFL